MRITLRPEAEADLAEARDWYDARASGLGDCFGAAVARTLTSIREHARRHREVAPRVRRALVRGFPYSIFYLLAEEGAEVLAVLHHARRPGSWKQRL